MTDRVKSTGTFRPAPSPCPPIGGAGRRQAQICLPTPPARRDSSAEDLSDRVFGHYAVGAMDALSRLSDTLRNRVAQGGITGFPVIRLEQYKVGSDFGVPGRPPKPAVDSTNSDAFLPEPLGARQAPTLSWRKPAK